VQIAPLTDPRNPVRFFDLVLQRPAVTLAALIATVALGARALIGLGSSVDQGVGRPAIGITVRYSGALPVDVERAVVRPIERRVAGLDGIVRTEATAREGVGRVVLYFDYLRHLEDAFQPVHDSVGAVRSELPPEYTREVAAYLDQALKKVLSQGPLVETHKAAILAALDITNELFQAKQTEREVAARLAAVTDDLAKMLPPAKRKAISAS